MTKKLEEKTIDSYSSYVRLFGFYTQQNVNSVVKFMLETGLQHELVLLAVGILCSRKAEISVSPLSEFEKRIYSSDPGPETGSLMQFESRRAVPQVSQPQ